MRLFIAATFPEEIIHDLENRVTRFRSRLPPASWARPGSQHMTFAFLGEQHESSVARIEARLAPAIAAIPAFTACLHGCGVFPNARHPRVGWVGLDPEAPFVETARVVREAVERSGIEFEKSEFKPHLTLMRIRDPWPPASVELFHRSLQDYQSAQARIDSVTLYSSRLDPKGAVHTPLREFRLGA